MLATLLSLAAETAEEEPSKTAFYILGGAAAVWAIVLFSVGMRSPTFPGSAAAQRGVIAISVLLVISAMASAVLTA
jgi:mannitol-specific phosphotransferase system IIBC component